MRDEFSDLKIPLPIAIIGMGITGEATLQLLLACGVPRNQISTFDLKSLADFQDPVQLMQTVKPQSLCVSPGVPLASPWISEAAASGLRITSELEIAFSFLSGETVIAITGSVGKSTTTSILGAGAEKIDPQVFVGGNLGTPLATYSTNVIKGSRKRADFVVLELSSYQLENFRNLKADFSILTYLSPNHLERYPSLEKYYETKLSLLTKTSRLAVLNKYGGSLFDKWKGLQTLHPNLDIQLADRESSAFKFRLVQKPALVGVHNQDNLAMAFLIADSLKWPQVSYEAMLGFPGLPHRLENLGHFKNILFLNDSKATTIDSVLQAIASVESEFPGSKIHLLLGGRDKNLPWQDLTALRHSPTLTFSFFGEFAHGARDKSALTGASFKDLKTCLAQSDNWIHGKEIVLLSPGGTSHDEFKNFEERGTYFKNWVLSKFQNS